MASQARSEPEASLASAEPGALGEPEASPASAEPGALGEPEASPASAKARERAASRRRA
jgi:hypothetical protein